MQDVHVERRPTFIDIHTHMIPSGDDGVASIEEALLFCREAARRGTAVLYATPHVNPALPLSRERLLRVEAAKAEMVASLDDALDFRIGFELFPTRQLLDEDPRGYQLDQLDCVLIECPLPHQGESELATAIMLAEHVEAFGLLPIFAHPERMMAVMAEPQLALEVAERGWVLQITAGSILGRHGTAAQTTSWTLLRSPRAIVASDGHRSDRPPFLDAAYARVAARFGTTRARALFQADVLATKITDSDSKRSEA
jgi:protein-tyrosine phosphatase